jgi:hypothetical protein
MIRDRFEVLTSVHAVAATAHTVRVFGYAQVCSNQATNTGTQLVKLTTGELGVSTTPK